MISVTVHVHIYAHVNVIVIHPLPSYDGDKTLSEVNLNLYVKTFIVIISVFNLSVRDARINTAISRPSVCKIRAALPMRRVDGDFLVRPPLLLLWDEHLRQSAGEWNVLRRKRNLPVVESRPGVFAATQSDHSVD